MTASAVFWRGAYSEPSGLSHAMHVSDYEADTVESLNLLKFHRKQIAGLDTYRFGWFTTVTYYIEVVVSNNLFMFTVLSL